MTAALLESIDRYVGGGREACLATIVSSYDGSRGPQVIFDGDVEPSGREYLVLQPYLPYPGDRVLMIPVGSTYVIAGSVSTSRERLRVVASSGTLTIGNAGGGDVPLLAITLQAQANVSYLLVASWYGVSPGGTSGDFYTFKLRRNGTPLHWQRHHTEISTNNAQVGSSMVWPDVPGAGLVTYDFTGNHDTGGAYSSTMATPVIFFVLEME